MLAALLSLAGCSLLASSVLTRSASSCRAAVSLCDWSSVGDSLASFDDTDSHLPEGDVPVPFRPLSQQEIVDKLNAVPAFSIANSAQQTLATPDEAGELQFTFYLSLADAQAQLAALAAANPGVQLSLAVLPLGSAFALAEWGQLPPPLEAKLAEAHAELVADEPPPPPPPPPRVRLVGAAAELDAAAEALDGAAAPPLLRQRNRRLGALPLFGSDALRFQLDGEELLPLFFTRADLLSAWGSSGGEGVPEVQLTDVRTLAWRMQFDDSQQWRSVLFVAPQDAIDFVQAQQEREAQQGAPPPPPPPAEAPPLQLSKADVQALIFGS